MIALNCNAPLYVEDYEKLGVTPGTCRECHTGLCPVGVTTQDPELAARLEVEAATERVVNFINAMTMEIQMLARCCGKSERPQPGARGPALADPRGGGDHGHPAGREDHR